MPSRPGCTCPMTDVGEMRWPLKHRCRADRAARRRYCATRLGLSCVLRRHVYHVRVLTLGHVLRKKKNHGLSLFLCGACSRTWNGYIHPCQIACIVFIQTTAEMSSARGGQRGVFTNYASPCHDIGSNQAANHNRRLRAPRLRPPSPPLPLSPPAPRGKRHSTTAPSSIVGGPALGEFLVRSWRHIGDTQRSSVANVSRRGANCVGDGITMGARRQRISSRPCRIRNKHKEHPVQLPFSAAKVWI